MNPNDTPVRIPTPAQATRRRSSSPGVTFDDPGTVDAWWDAVLSQGEPTGADTTTELDAWRTGRRAA